MEFRFEDILKNIIPGMIALCGIVAIFLHIYGVTDVKSIVSSDLKDYSEVILLFIIVGSYLAGYLMDALSSNAEHYCIYLTVGPPSIKLLSGKCSRIRLINYEAIIKNIQDNYQENLASITITNNLEKDKKIYKLIFQYANYLKDGNKNEIIRERVKEYYYSYLFSRNLLFSFLFSSILLVVSFHGIFSIGGYIMISVTVILLFFRRTQKSYYYTRQVLLASYYKPSTE